MTEADDSMLLERITFMVAQLGVDFVVPGGGTETPALSRLQPSRCFPVPDAPTFRRMNDKWAFYEVCRDIGIPVPKTIYVGPKLALDLDRIETEIGFPAVIKPTNQGDGNGVAIVASRDEARSVVIENPSYQFQPLIVQEFIPGIDIDCSLLTNGGETICGAVQMRKGNRIVFTRCPQLVADCSRLLEATRYSGLAHLDARLDNRDGIAKCVECNPRVWASLPAAARCGLNFMTAGLEIAAGEPISQPRVIEEGFYINPMRLTLQLIKGREWSALRDKGIRAGLWQAYSDPYPFIMHEFAAYEKALRIRRELKPV
jgi:predicted ATP-grasp superfamily ATP-dependent carboligase